MNQLRDDFGIGVAGERRAVLDEFFAQFTEILDDAIVNDGDAIGRVRVRVALGRLAVRRPARMTDAGVAGQRLAIELRFEVLQLAFGAAAREMAALERRNPR